MVAMITRKEKLRYTTQFGIIINLPMSNSEYTFVYCMKLLVYFEKSFLFI